MMRILLAAAVLAAGAHATTTQYGFQCAGENGVCSCTGEVTYGNLANDNFATPQISDGSISCSNGQFGDPSPGDGKACFCNEFGDQCAGENGACSCVGTVSYGNLALKRFATPQFSYGSISCSNGQFGDPSPGDNKDCYCDAAEQCAGENGVCSCTGMVQYGNIANGNFATPQFSDGSISCSNGQFGDPSPGDNKDCYCTTGSAPTSSPTVTPTDAPTVDPTGSPTLDPTNAPTNGPTLDPTSAPTGSPTASHVDTATALASYGSGSFVGVSGDDVYHCSDAHDGCLKNSATARHVWTRVDEVPYQANDAMLPFDTFAATTSDGAWATEPGAITFRNEVDQYGQKFPTSCDCQSGGKE